MSCKFLFWFQLISFWCLFMSVQSPFASYWGPLNVYWIVSLQKSITLQWSMPILFPCLKKTATSNIVSASCSSMILVIASPAIMSTPSMFHYRYCFLFLFPKPPRKVCSFCLTECCDIFVFLSNQLFVLQFLCPFLTCIYQTVSYHSYTLVHNHLHLSKV